MTKLTDNFTVEEFTASDTAARLGFDNSLPADLVLVAQETCQMLERIRFRLGRLRARPVPIIITSGYRCPRLNAVIGSAPTSDHLRACAADFKAPEFGSAFEVASALAPLVDELRIGQLIHEYGTWVHVSTRRPDKVVNRVITISAAGTQVGIHRVGAA